MNDEFEKGAEAYKALIKCVDVAINEKNGPVALTCANGLKAMTEVEQGNYFGGNLVKFPRMKKPLKRQALWNIAIDRMKDTVDYLEYHEGKYPVGSHWEYEEFKDYVEKVNE